VVLRSILKQLEAMAVEKAAGKMWAQRQKKVDQKEAA